MKTSLTCSDWRPLHRNTLRGFAQIEIKELRLKIHDVAVHEKDGRRWAQLPAKPQIRDGTLVTGDDGRVQYYPVMSFDTREVADAFSRAVIAAVLEHSPRAFDTEERPMAPQRAEVDDAIPF
jgi:hypothetical protein